MRGGWICGGVGVVVTAAAACVGEDPLPPSVIINVGADASSGGTSGLSSGGTSGGDPSDGGGLDAEVPDAAIDADAGATVRCGATDCPVSVNGCCYDPGKESFTCMFKGQCGTISTMRCDSADDCAIGLGCCASEVEDGDGTRFYQSSCQPLSANECPDAGPRLCRSTDECGTPKSCTPLSQLAPSGYSHCR